MNVVAIITLVLIGGFVWGGFLFFLVTGIRRERGKAG